MPKYIFKRRQYLILLILATLSSCKLVSPYCKSHQYNRSYEVYLTNNELGLSVVFPGDYSFSNSITYQEYRSLKKVLISTGLKIKRRPKLVLRAKTVIEPNLMVSTLVIKKDRLEIPDNWPVVNNEVENRYTIPESSVAERLLGHILRIYPDGGNYYIFLASVNQGTYKNESADSQNSNLGQAMYSLPREYNNRIFPSIKLGSRYTSNK